MSLKVKVERTVEITAYGQYGQRDEHMTTKRTVKTLGDKPGYVWIGNDRYEINELVEALDAVQPERTVPEYSGIYARGTK